MGSYPREKLLALEDVLLRQDALKKRAIHYRKHVDLKDPAEIGRELELPEQYVRNFAWERRLNCFPGGHRQNDVWLAAYSVACNGLSVREASAQTGFTIDSIENFMHRQGWHRYVLWGSKRLKLLVVPQPFKDAGWRTTRKLPGIREMVRLSPNQQFFKKKRR